MLDLELRFADLESLTSEVMQNLRRGRAFIAGATGVAEREACALVLVHPQSGATLRLDAEAVYVKGEEPGCGIGLQLVPFDPSIPERLLAFATPAEPVAGADHEEPVDLVAEEDEPALEELPDDEPAALGPSDSGEHDLAAAARDDADPAARNLQERIRRLSTTEQQRVARTGMLTERIVLERVFGPAVWESLLGNSRLSIPEVARIAKKGTLPRPLVDVIAANGSWVAAGEVQRALLSNPRSSLAVVQKILRAMPKTELARVPQQTAYPMAARQAAKKMLGE